MDTAAEVVVAVPAGDDAGARTADLYDWQAAMATADGLRLFADALDGDGHLLPEAGGRIICEHHEDWTVLNDPDAELVSAKHREPSSGAWTTIKQLVDKGGLAHLFGRWLVLDEKPNVRLVTCAALAPGDPRKLAKVTVLLRDQAAGCELDALTLTLVNEVAMGFAKELLLHRDGLPEEWRAPAEATAKTYVVGDAHGQKVRSFLAMLFIDDGRPHREVTEHAAPSMYMQPVLDKLGRRDVPASAVWEAVLQLFRVRMRAQGPIQDGALPLVLMTSSNSGGATSAFEVRRALLPRTIDVHDIAIAIRTALANPLGYMPLSVPGQLSKLSVKMAWGGCADTSISRAERLRSDFKRYWRERDDSVPGSAAERYVMERTFLRVADEATSEVRTATGTWGSPFWIALANHLDRLHESGSIDGLDNDLALGGICDLAAKCEVWFSPRFDVKAEIARLRAERAAKP